MNKNNFKNENNIKNIVQEYVNKGMWIMDRFPILEDVIFVVNVLGAFINLNHIIKLIWG